MIWILFILIIIGVSFFLTFRSMRDYQDTPDKDQYGLFLIRNMTSFNSSFFDKLLTLGNHIYAFERLYKGPNNALVWYCPKDVALKCPELSLLEIEDYSLKINESQVQGWEIGVKRLNHQAEARKYEFFKDLIFDENEQIDFQIVCTPTAPNKSFQTTIRSLVIAPDSLQRARIAKEVDSRISHNSPLKRLNKKHTSLEIFKSFKERGTYPKEVIKQTLPSSEVLALLHQ